MTSDLHIDTARLLRELQQLARITDAEPAANGTAVTRVVFTPRDLEARAWLRSLAEQAGLGYRVDPIGNTFVRLEGTDPALPAVATGSHIDAIPGAGMYDGTVGVLGGLEALRAIQRTGTRPRRSLELIVFTAEEPTRFGVGCVGSRLLARVLSPEAASSLQDDTGLMFDQVRAAAGFEGPLADVPLAPGAYDSFVELHIEQGALLERAGIPLGIVTHIAAPASYRFTIEGLGGHAGGLLMPDRRDALCGAAELILAVEHHARGTGAIDTVATVGTCAVYPGAVNSVPSRVTLQLDIRDTDATRRESVMHEIRQTLSSISERRGLRISETAINIDDPAPSSEHLVSILEETCRELGYPSMRMVSRAYHDSSFMALVAPIAMLFIPCRGGVSHRPDEFAAPEDITRGADVLARALLRVASR